MVWINNISQRFRNKNMQQLQKNGTLRTGEILRITARGSPPFMGILAPGRSHGRWPLLRCALHWNDSWRCVPRVSRCHGMGWMGPSQDPWIIPALWLGFLKKCGKKENMMIYSASWIFTTVLYRDQTNPTNLAWCRYI